MDADPRPQSLSDRPEVVLVRAENSNHAAVSNSYDVDVNNVACPRPSGERADLMCFVVPEPHNVAAPKEPPQLRLLSRPAHLGHNRGGGRWYES